MAHRMSLLSDEGERTDRIRQAAKEAQERFEALPEEEQLLYRASQRISHVYGQSDRPPDPEEKERIARSLMTTEFGPKFAERVLADPELRKKIHLDSPVPDTDDSSIARTVVADD